MSSYRGAWDGGPPGAEAEYATQRPTAPYAHPPHPAHPAHSTHPTHPTHPPHPPQPSQPPQPPHRAMPTTDPWTGVSYSQYGPPPNYDYHAYGAASSYGYSYDSSYYQQQDGNYYGKYPDSRATHLSQQYSNYNYPPRSHDRSKSPGEPRSYDRRRRSYKSNSRSVSPYENRTRAYSRKRDSSYEDENRWRRSRSRSIKSKRTRYSSSDHTSSRSRSSSRSSLRKDKKKNRQSVSSNSSTSERSYKKTRKSRGSDHSLTPPLKKRGSNEGRSKSRSPKIKIEKETLKEKDVKSHSSKEDKIKDKRQRDVATPPCRKKNETSTSAQKGNKKPDRSSLTPPRSYNKSERSATPQRHYKFKDRKSESPHRKGKDGSITPPKCYARSRSSSSSRSRSRSSTPRHLKHKRSHTPKSRSRSVSSSSRSSSSSRGSRSKSDRRNKRKSVSKHRSHSRSLSKHHSIEKRRSKSRRRSKSKGKNRRSRTPKSKSRSRSHSTRSRSRSGSHSDDERRGQFTVADRKRFWKLHKSRQEKEKEKLDRKSPLKEMKPPPGAVEAAHVDDIEYGDPPEVEGPNFAELLPTPEQVMQQSASTSKSKSIPMPIKNDGSFLEMFKKMQEETKKTDTVEEKKPEIKKPALPFIGKRRGGRVLKTGLVKKAKAIDEQTTDSTPKDAWSLYMQEVKKYRETSCEEERKTRPLVK